jgi:hypothetical protein
MPSAALLLTVLFALSAAQGTRSWSVIADEPASQYVEKVKAQQATVAGDMRSTSEPIVLALVTEALKATMEKRVP